MHLLNSGERLDVRELTRDGRGMWRVEVGWQRFIYN